MASNKMTLQFCTLFNSAYLARGLAMFRSLENVCSDFHLYVFAFDEVTFNYFKTFPEKNLTVISLAEFEDESLLEIKPSRTTGEYCWTCTSSTILYCIEKFDIEHCTYIDADMIFYSDPKVLHDELKEDSILLTEHRYTPAYDQSATSGVYCVQYITFRNDKNGLAALKWWRNACIDWCFNRLEEGKFGDQKYLDDWTTRFKGVHVLKHPGGGVAPWNVQQYDLVKGLGQMHVRHIATDSISLLVFFHFHGLRFYSGNMVSFTGAGYALSNEVKRELFKPYASELFKIADELHSGIALIANANGTSGEVIPSRMMNCILVLKDNFRNQLRFWLGRRSTYRKSGNHIYHRSEL